MPYYRPNYELTAAKDALDDANALARALLTDNVLLRLVPELAQSERATLQQEWSPFNIYRESDGAGLMLSPDRDFLTRRMMRYEELWAALEQIAIDAISSGMQTGDFLTDLLGALQ